MYEERNMKKKSEGKRWRSKIEKTMIIIQYNN